MKHLWKQLCPEGKENQPPPDEELFSAKQLILSPDESKVICIKLELAMTQISLFSSQVVEGTVYPGESALAMVAWRMTLRTPECPEVAKFGNIILIL